MGWTRLGAAGCGSGDGWRAAGLALVGTLLLAAPGPAAPPVYTLGSVQAQDGNPIRDETGLLYSARFDPACQTLVGAIASPAFSAALQGGKPATLKVQAVACGTTEPPKLACTVSLGGSSVSSPPGFRGWQLTLTLPLPATTGVYPVRLACRVERSTVTVPEATLYLTYRPPLPSVAPLSPKPPPRRVWYERACTWGAGLAATASEEEVLRTVLDGLYSYGQGHWRYGFCQISTDGKTCTFGSTVVSTGDPHLQCSPSRNPPICWCPWTTLVEGDSTFNFGDCFKYSDALQFIAAATGVAVGQGETQGANRQGLATRPGLRSLDPAFAGNLWCGNPPQPPCAYTFGNHSLVVLPLQDDLLFFDPTFGQVYTTQNGPVGASVCGGFSGNLQFPSFLACLRPGDYGTFPFYQSAASSCPRDESRPAFFATTPPRPRVVPYDEAKSLAVDLVVEVKRPGEYRVVGGIYGGSDGNTPIALHPIDRLSLATMATLSVPSLAVPSASRQTVSLLFSGEELARAPLPPPYVVRAAIFGERGLSAELSANLDLQGIPFQDLGERPARFGAAAEIRAKIVIAEGREVVRVTVPVTVRVPGTLVFQGRLTQGARAVAYAGGPLSLTLGERELTLDLPAEEGFDRHPGVPYGVTLSLTETEPPSYVDSVWAAVTPASR
jgi:hypothetical protein